VPFSATSPSWAIQPSGTSAWDTAAKPADALRFATHWNLTPAPGTPPGTPAPPLPLDPDGYPTTVPAGWRAVSYFLGSPYKDNQAGIYTLTYKGNCTFIFSPNAKIVGSYAVPGAPDVSGYLVSVDTARSVTALYLESTGGPQGNFRSASFWAPGFGPGSPFWQPQFVNRWKGSSVVRMMELDGTTRNLLSDWSARPNLTRYTYMDSGLAYEHQLSLAAATGSVPWVHVPTYATTDFVDQFVAFLAASPFETIVVEYTNEPWNTPYPPYKYCESNGLAAGYGSPTQPFKAANQWAAWQAANIARTMTATLGDRVLNVLGCWNASSTWLSNALAFVDPLAFQAVATAPYAIIPPPTDPVARAAWPDTVASWSLDSLFAAMESSLDIVIGCLTSNVAVANRFGLPVWLYECGHNIRPPAKPGDPSILQTNTALYTSAQYDPRMGTFYRNYYNRLRAAGVAVAAHCSSEATDSAAGMLGLLKSWVSGTSPKYAASVAYAAECGQAIGG
jgi:hypothetical protein